jgi:hypothetical protein
VLKLAVAFVFLGVILIAIYAVPREGSGYGVDVPNIAHRFGDLTALIGYVIVGTQLGGIVRGLGIFPIRELDLTIQIFPLPLIRFFDDKAHVLWAVISLTIVSTAGLLLILRYLSRDRVTTLALLCLGQLILLTSLFLPALGRSKWGMLFSLAPRYQYAALLGVLIFLLPFCLRMLREASVRGSVRRGGVAFYSFATLLIAYFGLHLHWSQDYRLFVDYAQMNRGFVSQLDEWKQLKEGPQPPNPELAPVLPWRLAPNFSSEQVELIVRALRGG